MEIVLVVAVLVAAPTHPSAAHKLFRRSALAPPKSIWDLPEAIEGVPFVPYDRHVAPLSLSLSAIEETLHGTIWNLISPLLTTDNVVECKTEARR